MQLLCWGKGEIRPRGSCILLCMQERAVVRGLLLSFLILGSAVTIPLGALATCERPGSVEITSEETRALARAAGVPDSCTHWDPKQPYVGQGVGEAKAYLLSIAKNLRNSQAPPDREHIEPLHPTFAICAAKFLQDYAKQYGAVHVVSAFRCGPRSPASISCDRSENARAGGATNSNHQIGIALDINPAAGSGASYDTLKSFSDGNPGYGVTFPWPQYNGSTDKPHMQATNKTNPACTGVTGVPVASGPAVSASPTAAAAQLLRNWLSPQQTQPQQVVTPTVSQPASVSPNTLSAFQEPQTIGGVSGQLTLSTTSTTSSVADRLEMLAFPTTTQTGGTATTVPLVVSGQQAAQLAPGQQATMPTYTGQGDVSPSQSTFISGDLSWQGAPQPPQQLTGFQATLANVRAILERILEFLIPFNARNALQGDVGDQEIYILE